MSKGPWKRHPVFGITLMKLDGGGLISRDGVLRVPLREDCDLNDVRSIASAAGFGARVDHFKDRALAQCSSYFHLYPIVDEDGKVLGYQTHTNSAEEGGRNYRAAAKARQLAGKGVTDVSGASNLVGNSPPIETRVTEQQESGGGSGVALIRA